MNKTGRWSYNECGSEYWSNDDYETRQDAIEAAFENEDFVKSNVEKDDEKNYMLPIAVGEIKQPNICDSQDVADVVLDFIRDHHADVYGEHGCDYLDNVKKEQEDELNELLTKVIDEWADKYKLQPTHYLIENTDEDNYCITEKDANALKWANESESH